MKSQRILLFSDCHVPHQDETIIGLLKRIRDRLPFDRVICLGDLLDAEFLINEYATDDFQKHVDAAKRIIGEIGCDTLLEGNHYGPRLRRKMTPALHNVLAIDRLLELPDLEIVPYSPNEIHRVGKLGFLHGVYHGVYAVRKHLEIYGSCVMGHVHSSKQWTHQIGGDLNQCTSLGCTCRLEMPWHRTPMGHNLGFATATVFADGTFQVQNYVLHRDMKRVVVDDHEFKLNWK